MNGSTRLRDRKINRGWLAVFAVILFGALTLRLWNLGTQSLWHDEAWSVFSGYHPLAWGELGTDVNAPPIFYMTLGLWQNLAGDSVWAMRCWSALLGTITVAVALHIARRWFSNRIAAITAVFVAVSPMLWVFSQEIRAYVMMPLMALILLLPLDQFIRSQPVVQRRIWLWILVLEAVTLYIHNLSVPIIAWLNATVILTLLWQRYWRRLATWIVSQIGVAILYLPWLLTQKPTGTPLNTPPKLDPVLIWNIWQSYFTGIKAMVSADGLLMALTAIFGLIAVVAIVVALLRGRSRRTLLLLSQVTFLPIFELGIILAAHIDFHPRYFVVGIPATLMLIALGLDRLTRYQPMKRVALVGASALAIAIMVRMGGVMYSSSIYQHDDFRSIAERYAKLGPDDAIIIPYGWEPTLDYYSRKMNFKAKFINVPLYSSTETIISRLQADLQGVQRAELLTWYQLPADVRGAYPCLLSVGGDPTESLTVNGLKTETYSLRYPSSSIPNNALPFDPTPVDFGVVQLVSSRLFSPVSNYACVVARWQLSTQAAHTAENWHISVGITNPFGWDIARADTSLLSDQQLPTSLWRPDTLGTTFSVIKLPDGTPGFFIGPEETFQYPATLRLYNDSNLQAVASIKGSPVADTPIGTVSAGWAVSDVKPTSADIDCGYGWYLHQKDMPTGELQPGQTIRVTLEWWVSQLIESPVRLLLLPHWEMTSLEGDGWHEDSLNVVAQAHRILTWHQFTVPATATGKAVLKTDTCSKQMTLAEYNIAPISRQFSEPNVALTKRTEASFGGLGTLVGIALDPVSIDAKQPLPVTLVWRASSSPQIAYKVFVHLLDQNNQVIAQNDAEPVNGTRPTTSWVNGEYVTDLHNLTFNRIDYHGPATLEVGLYDPNNGQRVLLSDGTDHAIIPGSLTVK